MYQNRAAFDMYPNVEDRYRILEEILLLFGCFKSIINCDGVESKEKFHLAVALAPQRLQSSEFHGGHHVAGARAKSNPLGFLGQFDDAGFVPDICHAQMRISGLLDWDLAGWSSEYWASGRWADLEYCAWCNFE
jgi:hypothetical protein